MWRCECTVRSIWRHLYTRRRRLGYESARVPFFLFFSEAVIATKVDNSRAAFTTSEKLFFLCMGATISEVCIDI